MIILLNSLCISLHNFTAIIFILKNLDWLQLIFSTLNNFNTLYNILDSDTNYGRSKVTGKICHETYVTFPTKNTSIIELILHNRIHNQMWHETRASLATISFKFIRITIMVTIF